MDCQNLEWFLFQKLPILSHLLRTNFFQSNFPKIYIQNSFSEIKKHFKRWEIKFWKCINCFPKNIWSYIFFRNLETSKGDYFFNFRCTEVVFTISLFPCLHFPSVFSRINDLNAHYSVNGTNMASSTILLYKSRTSEAST